MTAGIKTSLWDKMFDVLLNTLMIIFCISTLYPFLHLLTTSLLPADVPLTKIYIIPPRVSFQNYLRVLTDAFILYGFKSTIIRTILGTASTLVITMLMAYPLSKKYFPFRTLITALVVFTMYFQGGLIPSYLLVRNMGLFNSYWALVLPNLINAFHLIIMRNFFMAIPDSLEESARIDGANDITIFIRIIIPVSKPIIATVLLWTAVWHWNSWFDALLYITDLKKQVLQNVMRRIVLDGLGDMFSSGDETSVSPENVKAATIMVTTIPIVAVYPFIQKYFVKGVMVGSIKG